MKFSKILSSILCFVSVEMNTALACDDPCPSTELGKQFEMAIGKDWLTAIQSTPVWRGVFSFHSGEDSKDQYMAFVSDSSSLLVAEASCDLSGQKSTVLKWAEPGVEESDTIKALEKYYQGIEPISIRKAVYSSKLTVYLLEVADSGKTERAFRLYYTNAAGQHVSLGGAYAYPFGGGK